MRLTKVFSPGTYARALESWSWLDLDGKSPVLASLFGDTFLQDRDGYWFLDSLEGQLTLVAGTRDDLQIILGTAEGQDHYLLAGLVMAAERRGLKLGPSQVYDFRVPPILGGKTDVDSVTVMDFVVSMNIAGQIYHQVRDLPPGTQITGFQVQE